MTFKSMVAMPSPHGTNRAGLYLEASRFAPIVGAYDARPRRGFDEREANFGSSRPIDRQALADKNARTTSDESTDGDEAAAARVAQIADVIAAGGDAFDVLHEISLILSENKLSLDEPPLSPGGAPRLHGQDAALRSRLATAEGVRQGRAARSYDAMFGKRSA